VTALLLLRLQVMVFVHYTSGDGATHAWQSIWLVPAMMSGVLLILFAAVFEDTAPPAAVANATIV
jgi:hypothetical protein